MTVPVTIRTLAGQSAPVNATYAGIPTVTGVTATGGPAAGEPAGPSTGGTPIDVTGTGFANQVLGLLFVDSFSPFSIGTQYMFTAHSDTDITSTTVPQNPAVVDVEVCTVTGCSPPSPRESPVDVFFLYPPGDPKVDSIDPASGPANGGTLVTITGQNLGCVTSVSFGKWHATKVSNSVALLDCGSTTQVTVTAPPGKVGKSVRVTVTTVESDLTGFGPSTGTALFTYAPAALQRLRIKRVGDGVGTVKSAPAGVNCGSGCTHLFPYGSKVTLTAKGGHRSVFAGWLGACSGKGKCTVQMSKAKLVKAQFALSH